MFLHIDENQETTQCGIKAFKPLELDLLLENMGEVSIKVKQSIMSECLKVFGKALLSILKKPLGYRCFVQ